MKDEPSLDNTSIDWMTAGLKGAAGAVPLAGGIIAEFIGAVVPNQRTDRIAAFAKELGSRMTEAEAAILRASLSDENFADLFEETLLAAARALTDVRRKYLANILLNGVTAEHVKFAESKHLLRILGQVNDVEVLWLKWISLKGSEEHEEFYQKNEGILKPVGAHLGSQREELDRDTLRNSYREHLVQLDLLAPKFKIDSKSKMPVYDRNSGRQEIRTHDTTRLGRLLLRHIGETAMDSDSDEPANAAPSPAPAAEDS